MKTTDTLLAVTLATLCLAPPAPAWGQETEGSFSGRFALGFRAVDVGGAERKFKEDINLDDGARLFDLDFDFIPTEEGFRRLADRVELSASNLGGDPFETFRIGVRKLGAYDFRFDRRKSTYFYDDIILPPALASIPGSTGGDFHTFDFDRVRDTAKLDIELSPAAELTFGFERFTKTGEATTTLDIQRDEFELDRVIDESLDTYLAGFSYRWEKATLVFEERLRDYENVVEIFLPGFSLGESFDDPATLDFFFLDQPYDFTSREHTVRLLGRPHDRLDVRLAASFQDLDLDVTADERSQGTTFRGDPFTTDLAGDGEIERDLDLYDLDVTYAVSDRVAIVGSVYRRELDQAGDLRFGGALNLGFWDIETTGAEAGVEIAVSPRLTLSGGVASESRDVTFGHGEDGDLELETESTDRDGFYATVAWRPSRAFELTASLEDNSFDDPFTLASPTDRQRYRLRGRYRWANGFSVTGIYLTSDFENENSGWNADSEQINLRLGYQTTDLDLSVGYSILDVERRIDQLVTGGSRQVLFPIFYQADSDFLDGRVRWTASDRLTLGGSFLIYDNGGSFALERDDYRVFAEIGFERGYLVHLGYRLVDYDEDAFDFDDYDADVAEVAIGYRW